MDLSRKSSHKENSKAWWNERYSASSNFLYSKEPSEFLVRHLSLLPTSARILEVGCGEGRNSVALAAKGFKVISMDFSDVALERARRLMQESQLDAEFKQVDLDLFIPDLLAFDAIVSIDFKPPLTLMKNLGRGLKQGGHLLIEAHLISASKELKWVEPFECFKPNELISQFIPSQSASFQTLFYSEISAIEGTAKGDKAQFIAKKTQLL